MSEDEKRSFSRPFEQLKDLKARLPRARPRRQPDEASSSPPESEPAATEPTTGADPTAEPDFEALMSRLAVEPLPEAPERPARRPPTEVARRAEGAAVRASPRRVAKSGRRGAKDGFDHTTPRLDLHGFTVADALVELARRFGEWRSAGLLRARIVTGRGAHSGDGRAEIREAVERWLETAPGVAALHRGNAEAGGDGVVLVELIGPGRRHR